jgi:hypothetical protein
MTRKGIILGALLAGAVSVRAQAPDMQQKVAAIKQSVAENAMAMRKYQWLESTTIAYNGEVKNTIVNSCNYSAPGPKPTCTEISSTPAEKPSGGPLKKKMIENKIAEMKAYMDSVKMLLVEYVPPQGEKIQAAMAQGNVAVAPNPSAGAVSLVISNYYQAGDKVTMIFGDPSKQIRAVNISTYVGQPSSVVTVSVTFAKLGDGTRYAQKKVLSAASQGITVTTISTGFALAVGN